MKSRNLLSVLILFAALGIASYVFAQAQTQNADPCAIYPHQSAIIAAATPTQKLVTGVAGKQIYVCAVHLVAPAGTPGFAANTITFYDGQAAASTPCATNSPVAGALLGVYGGAGDHGSNYTQMVVPASASTPTFDLCYTVGAGNSVTGGIVEYIQR